jgi:hypothetical protein
MSAKKVDDTEFTIMYMAGEKMAMIAAHFGCSVTVLKKRRQVLGLPPRDVGRAPEPGCRCKRCVKAGRYGGPPTRHSVRVRGNPPGGLMVDDWVELDTPDNPRVHGVIGVVVGIEHWGAHVQTNRTATGRFRASRGEMVFIGRG